MIDRGYTIRWVGPDDSEAIAAVEARVHHADHRSGAAIIRAQLEETEYSGRNLSVGLFRGLEMVGFGLVFVMRSRREMASFFDVPVPEGIDADAPTIYIADYVVDAEHRRGTRLMSDRFALIVNRRQELRTIAMDAFSTPEYADKWAARKRWLAGVGWEYESRYSFFDQRLNTQMNWVTFKRLPRGKQDDSRSWRDFAEEASRSADGLITYKVQAGANWHAVASVWQTLLSDQGTASIDQSWEYILLWSAHFTDEADLHLFVTCRNDRPIAAVALGTRCTRGPRMHRRYLTSLSASGIRGCAVAGTDPAAFAAIARLLIDSPALADGLNVRSPENSTAFTDALAAEALAKSWLIARHSIKHFQMAPRAVHVSKELRKTGDLLSCRVFTGSAAITALERYFAIRESSLGKERKLGLLPTSADISFHRAMVVQHGLAFAARVAVASVADQDMAAALAFMNHGILQITHVVQSPSAYRYDAANALVTALVHECSRDPRCREVRIPDLPYLTLNSLPLRPHNDVELVIEQPTAEGRRAWLSRHIRVWQSRLQRFLMNARVAAMNFGRTA